MGANPAETMPPVMRYFEAQQRNGGTLIVADPRRSSTAQWAKLHLRLRPGSDAALANGLLHLLIREGQIDTEYIGERTEGFDDVKRLAAAYWPERVEMLTGVPQRDLVEAARMLGTARTAMVLTARGDEQVALSYDREATGEPGGRQVEYLMVDLDGAPLADYAVSVLILDRVTGRSVEALRRITVTDTPLPRN